MRTPLSVPRRQRRSETSEHSAPALTRGPPEPGRAPVQRIDSVVVRPAHPRGNGAGKVSTTVEARRALLHTVESGQLWARYGGGETWRCAAGGVVTSRAERRTKTLPVTEKQKTRSLVRGTVGVRPHHVDAPHHQCHGRGRFTKLNRLYLAQVAAGAATPR
jgi:hypothetical protein